MCSEGHNITFIVQERGLRVGNLRDHGPTFHRGTDLSLLLRGGAGKSLARPNSRCRRTESIVSLERGVFSCYRGWKEAYLATHAISTTWRRELSSSIFFSARQGAEGNSRHSDRNMHHRIPPSKTGWPSLDGWFFSPIMRLVLDDPKQWPPRNLLIKFKS